MADDGSGTFTLPSAPFVAGTTAVSADVNSNFSDIATGLTARVTRNGTGSMSGNLAMGNNKITGLAAGTASTDAARVGQVPVLPNTSGSSTAGHWQLIAPGSGVAATLPSGGTWGYFIFLIDADGAITAVGGFAASVAAGGSTIGSAVANNSWIGFAWRIA